MSFRRFRYIVAGLLGLVAVGVGCDVRRSPLAYLPRPGNPAASEPLPTAPLSVIRLEPTSGFPGDRTRIEGSGFNKNMAVQVDGLEAGITVVDEGLLVARLPKHPVGVADVVLMKPDGQRVTLAKAYTFETVTLLVSPVRAKTGETLTVRWAASSERLRFDLIALSKVGETKTDHFDDAHWKFTGGAPTGAVTFTAPDAGEYEFRYLVSLPNDDYRDYIDAGRSQTIEVQ